MIPPGLKVPGDPSKYALSMPRNLYGRKQSGRIWFQYLTDQLKGMGFKKSDHDPCVFFCRWCIYVLYTEDSLLFAQNKQTIQQVIQQLYEEDLQLTVKGTIAEFLGISITNTEDGIHLNQPLLIPKVLKDLHTNKVHNPPTIPANPSAILHAHKDGAPSDDSFNYRAMIGKLMYL